MRPTVISIVNNKGGVAKTTSAVYLGCAFARSAISTHIIDFDPQGDVESTLGVTLLDSSIKTEELIARSVKFWPATPAAGLMPLYLTPSTPSLNNIESMIANTSEPNVVRRVMTKIPYGLEYTQLVLIDCPPAFGNLTRAAISVSDYVIIPTNPVPANLKALSRTVEYVQLIAGEKSKPQIAGILFTRNQNYNINQECMTLINDTFPGLPFETSIRATSLIEETPIRGCMKPPLKRNQAAADYMAAAREIYERIFHKTLIDL